MKVAFIVLISEKGNREAAEEELEETVAKMLSHLKHWKLEKHSVIESS